MIREEPHPLPKSIGGLLLLALEAYGKRLGTYLALAVASIGLQSLVMLAFPANRGASVAANLCADAFIAAVVTIGVIADLGVKGKSTRTVFADAVHRWWVLAAIGFVELLLQLLFGELAAGTQQNAADILSTALTGVIITVLSCALNMGTVIGAIDTRTRSLLIVPASIGRGLAISLAWANIGRLLFLSAIVVIPVIVAGALDQQLTLVHHAQATFWVDTPIDALTTGPLQALFSVFYLDFVRRLIRAHVP